MLYTFITFLGHYWESMAIFQYFIAFSYTSWSKWFTNTKCLAVHCTPNPVVFNNFVVRCQYTPKLQLKICKVNYL